MSETQEIVIAQPAGPEKESWFQYRLKEEQDTPSRYEEAAKFLATMISISLTIFLSVTGLKEGSSPAGVAAILIFWLVSLMCAFLVLFPFAYEFSGDSVNSFRDAHQQIVKRKRSLLKISVGLYFFTLLLLAALYLLATFPGPPVPAETAKTEAPPAAAQPQAEVQPQAQPTPPPPAPGPEQKPLELEKLEQLTGTWRGKLGDGGMTYTETWKQEGQSLQGQAILENKEGKQVLQEILEIRRITGHVSYAASIDKSKPTVFSLVNFNKHADYTEWTFENKEHDFPQRIIYRLESKDSLYARVEGTEKGQSKKEEFRLRRIELRSKK